MKRCGVHLPGNIACPYPPLWRISTALLERAAFETTPATFRVIGREVCSQHLEHALISDIDRSPTGHMSSKVELLPE